MGPKYARRTGASQNHSMATLLMGLSRDQKFDDCFQVQPNSRLQDKNEVVPGVDPGSPEGIASKSGVL